MPDPVGPDCRDGKHPACDGLALDEHIDQIVACECPCHWDTLTSTPDSWGFKPAEENHEH